jgi:hypothetical protein
MMAEARKAGAATLIALLSLSAFLVVRDHGKDDSPTMDEPFHALAAAEYVISGTYYANLEHPPLAKLLAGVCLARAGARAPSIPLPFSGRTAEVPQHFAFFNVIAWQPLFAAARVPFAWIFVLLILATGAVAWRLGGPAAGVGAAALVAFEPGHLAHAAYLHTDLLCSLGFLATGALAMWALRRGPLAWIPAGLALGLTLAGKLTGVLLVPVLAAFAAWEMARRRRSGEPHALAPIAGLLLAGIAASAILLSCYAVAMRHMSAAEVAHAERNFLEQRRAEPATIAGILRVARLVPPAGHYLAGLAGIRAQDRVGGGVNILMGQRSVKGFPAYFPVAFAVKSALATLLALAITAGLWAFRPAARSGAAGALLAGPALVFLAGAFSSYNIGVRHILPIYPALAIAAAVALARTLPEGRAAAVLALLASLEGVEVARVHPYEISFFNAAAGGPARGARWLNDSNLDWGQDLGRLADALRRTGLARGATIAYFGGGVPQVVCPEARTFLPAETPVTPGLYAVSQYILAAGPEMLALRGRSEQARAYAELRGALLERGTPAGRVGYSILLYRLPPGEPPTR